MIIGVCGKKFHGKGSISQILIDHHGFKREYFAKPLKEALQILLSMTEEQVDGSLKETIDPRYGFTPREALQTLGTDWGRNLHKDIWAISCFNRMSLDPHSDYVLTDLRFLNEAAYIRQQGGYIIKVVRDLKSENFDDHISEKEFHEIQEDILIDNMGDLDDLKYYVEEALSYLQNIKQI